MFTSVSTGLSFGSLIHVEAGLGYTPTARLAELPTAAAPYLARTSLPFQNPRFLTTTQCLLQITPASQPAFPNKDNRIIKAVIKLNHNNKAQLVNPLKKPDP